MKYRTFFAGLLILAGQSIFSIQVPAQDAVTKKIILEGTTNNQTQNHLDVLTNRIRAVPSDPMLTMPPSNGRLPCSSHGDWKFPLKKPAKQK